MINKQKLTKLASGTALAIVLASGAAVAQEVTLRMHSFLPEQANVPQNLLIPWAEKVEAELDGRIGIQLFHGMALGGTPPQLMDQMMDGVADIVWTLPGYTPGRFPRTEVFELPFTMTTAEAASRAYWKLAEETMMDADFKDIHPIALHVHGPGVIHSKDPVEALEDLNGVKLRAPTRVTNMMFGALGATPIGMPVPAVPEALSKGVIDATVIPWEVTGALKVPELVTNHTEFGGDTALYTATFVFGMNKAKYDALPDDLKAVIDANSGLETSAWFGRQMQEDDAPERETALDLGNNVITLTDAQTDSWKAAAQGTIDAWIAEMDEKGLDGTAVRARALELIAEGAM
ncbi:TRAP transporter substrate-binding protein [Phaeobacter sp. J2-8]|uniref:TRAP transporter substrate-binding protein n=1 Tax=Phaeobacter sp. J2-8 TaxID=2931394 RepID=UPI001FD17ADC|nr:TRAP transporter substrate-binding protein [Phaeobacter sp. J2-8]MCJ7872977.1 TRAP transporter substrate-binding protein [Phaeobacter sp. J2-8]